MRKHRKWRQGVYSPENPQKYLGSQSPIYRSSYELKFFEWADKNKDVLKWGSENVVIPYFNPITKTRRRYFVDSFIIMNIDSKPVRFLIEIKPAKQTKPPTRKKLTEKSKRNLMLEQMTYQQNLAKWEAARKWCDGKGIKFLILTEKELNIKS